MYIKDFVLYPLIDNLVLEIKNDLNMTKEDFFEIDFSLSQSGSTLMFHRVYSTYLNSKTFKDLLGETEVICKCRFCDKQFSYGQFTEFIHNLYKFAKRGLETNGFYCSRSCSNRHSGIMQYHREQGRKNFLSSMENGSAKEGHAKWAQQMKEKFGEDFRKQLIKEGKWAKPFFTEEARKKIAKKKLNWTEEKKREMFHKRMETHFLKGTKLFGEHNDRNYSLISKECFQKLVNLIKTSYPDFEGKYAENEHVVGNRFLDFYNEKQNIWVEFNGNYFHANPELYNEDDEIFFGDGNTKTAKEIWESDKQRINEIKKNIGIDPIIIWEREYRKDSENCLNKIYEQVKTKLTKGDKNV